VGHYGTVFGFMGKVGTSLTVEAKISLNTDGMQAPVKFLKVDKSSLITAIIRT
jgi:hypothetical protein